MLEAPIDRYDYHRTIIWVVWFVDKNVSVLFCELNDEG